MTPDPVKEKVLARISAREVEPIPCWYFTSIEWSLRTLWVLSVLMGALAIAIILYVAEHGLFAFVEATHSNVWDFWFEVLPYLWIAIFVVMSALAYRNFRHTRGGYRYSAVTVVGSSIGLSVVGGILLHAGGFGAYFDHQFAEQMPATYPSLEKKELSMWQKPEDGRLVGAYVSDLGTTTVVFEDIDGAQWDVSINELGEPDEVALRSGDKVRIIGFASTTPDRQFYSCGVFAWVYDRALTMDEMRVARSEFLARMVAHKDSDSQLAREDENDDVFAMRMVPEAENTTPSRCAKHPVITRLEAAEIY